MSKYFCAIAPLVSFSYIPLYVLYSTSYRVYFPHDRILLYVYTHSNERSYQLYYYYYKGAKKNMKRKEEKNIMGSFVTPEYPNHIIREMLKFG